MTSRFLAPAVCLLIMGAGCRPSASAVIGGPAAAEAGAPDTSLSDSGVETGVDAAPDAAPGCVETPVPRRTTGVVVEFGMGLLLHGKPVVFGEENALPGGGTLLPTNLRFYVSGVALLRAGGDPIAVDLVTATGNVLPYGVYLYNAEDPFPGFHVLAPPGTYTGVTFLFGLDAVCNSGRALDRKPPLSPTSQMTWPHLAGYLFLRYEGRITGAPPEQTPAAVHMGGVIDTPSAPVIRLDGSIGAPSEGKQIFFHLDEMFRGATTDVDLSGFFGPPGHEVIAGEKLRRNAPMLRLFSLAPYP